MASCAASLVMVALCVFGVAGSEDLLPYSADAWGRCATLDTESEEWAIQVPPEADFTIDLAEGALRFLGSAESPALAPQATLLEAVLPLEEQVCEVATVVDIEDLGGVLSLDVDDADGRYNWSLDVSASQVTFGFADTTCGCGPGWIRLASLDESLWDPDRFKGRHVLRVVFERRLVRAYVDDLRIATFGLPIDVATSTIRLSVVSEHLPAAEGQDIGFTDLRILQLCLVDGS